MNLKLITLIAGFAWFSCSVGFNIQVQEVCEQTVVVGFAQKVPTYGFLCVTSVFSVSLWCVFALNSSTTETQRTQRLHREEAS